MVFKWLMWGLAGIAALYVVWFISLIVIIFGVVLMSSGYAFIGTVIIIAYVALILLALKYILGYLFPDEWFK